MQEIVQWDFYTPTEEIWTVLLIVNTLPEDKTKRHMKGPVISRPIAEWMLKWRSEFFMDSAGVGVSHSGSLYKTQPLENTTIFPLVLKEHKFNVTMDIKWYFLKLACLAFTKTTLEFNRQNFASPWSKQYLTVCQQFSIRYVFLGLWNL